MFTCSLSGEATGQQKSSVCFSQRVLLGQSSSDFFHVSSGLPFAVLSFLQVCSLHLHRFYRYLIPSPWFLQVWSLHLHGFCRYFHSISTYGVSTGMFTPSPSFLQVSSLHLHHFFRYVHSIAFAGMFIPFPSMAFMHLCSLYLHGFCRYVLSISIYGV